MHCEDLLSLIEKLADGEATAAEKERAEAHLEQCDSCREHFEFLVALPEAARLTPLPEPPGAYWEVLPRKVMARIEEECAAKPSGAWAFRILKTGNLRWLGALAAGAIAVVFGLQVLMLRQESASPVLKEAPKLTAPPRGDVGQQAEDSREVETEPLPIRRESESSKVEEGAPQNKEAVPEPAAPSRAVAATAAGERVEPPAERPEPKLAAAGRGREAFAEERKQESQPAVPGEAQQPVRSAAIVADERSQSARLQIAAADRGDSLEAYRLLDRLYVGRSTVSGLDKEDAASAASDLEGECSAWRGFLARFPKSDQAIDARYRLAVCSISLYDLRQTEEDRRQAIEDATSFIEASPGGERVEEVRRDLARIRG